MIKKQLTPAGSDPSKLNLGAIMLAGGSAGIAMWSIAIPPDVRPLLHTSSRLRGANPASSSWICDTSDHQIPPAVRSPRDVLWLHGLCEQDGQGSRRQGALEGVRTGHEQSVPRQRCDVSTLTASFLPRMQRSKADFEMVSSHLQIPRVRVGDVDDELVLGIDRQRGGNRRKTHDFG